MSGGVTDGGSGTIDMPPIDMPDITPGTCQDTLCDIKVFDILASLYVNALKYDYDQVFNGAPDGSGSFDDTVSGCCLTDSYDLEELVGNICYIYRLERKFEKEGLYIYRNRDLNDDATVVATIPESELAADNSGSKGLNLTIKTSYESTTKTVTQLAFNFLDADNEFKVNQLTAKRPEALQTDTVKQVSLPFVMHLDQADKLVNRVLNDSRLQLITHQFRLPPKYAWIGKGDVVEIDHGTFADQIRITDVDFNADKSSTCTGETVSTGSIEIRAMVHPQTSHNVGANGSPSTGIVLDIPLTDPGEAGTAGLFEYYMGVYPSAPGAWKGGYFALKVGSDAYQTIYFATGQAARGEVMLQWRASNVLSDKKWVTDTDTIKLANGTNSWNTNFNTTKGVIDQNPRRNMAVYGMPGRWEIIQFEGIANGEMYGVVRGLRGTEGNCGKHQSGDYVITLFPSLAMITLPNADLGRLVNYKTVSNDQYFEQVAEKSDPNALVGNSRWPFAPYHFRGTRDASNNVTFSWLRRDKLGSGWGQACVNSESQLSFSVDICQPNSGALLRTIVANDTSVVYSSADQSTDQAGGLTAFMLKIRQVGDIGPGFVGTEVVDV